MGYSGTVADFEFSTFDKSCEFRGVSHFDLGLLVSWSNGKYNLGAQDELGSGSLCQAVPIQTGGGGGNPPLERLWICSSWTRVELGSPEHTSLGLPPGWA